MYRRCIHRRLARAAPALPAISARGVMEYAASCTGVAERPSQTEAVDCDAVSCVNLGTNLLRCVGSADLSAMELVRCNTLHPELAALAVH